MTETKKRSYFPDGHEGPPIYPDTPKPPLVCLAGEALWPLSYISYMLAQPWLATLPAGDGHPVIMLPGMMADDRSTVPLRRFLSQKGYAVQGWNQGMNRGPRPGVLERLFEQVHQARKDSGGRKVTLIGWSLGGLYARLVANREPDLVRSVVTLAAPFTGNPHASRLEWLYELVTGHHVGEVGDFRRQYHPTPSVPCTSVFSRIDGVISWPCSIEHESETTENVQVFCNHGAMAADPTVLAVVADRLAQPEGEWRKFDLSGARAFFYGNARQSAAEADAMWPEPAPPAAA